MNGSIMRANVRSPEDLGLLVRRIRQSHGLSQAELAERIGVTPRYLSELETGKPKVADERFFRILLRLGVRLEAETVARERP